MLCSMVTASRSNIEGEIIDRAAGLFARHGFEHTSVRTIADAVGLSKAGLLHHFTTKEALRRAVGERADRLGMEALGKVSHLPAGPDRDRRAIETFVDVAAGHPGLVSFLLAPLSGGEPHPEQSDRAESDAPVGVYSHALAAFGLTAEPDPVEDEMVFERRVRVVGALVSLAVLSLSLSSTERPGAFRAHVISSSFDALGHRQPVSGSTSPSAASLPDQLEA